MDSVLVVDDEKDLLDVVSLMLTEEGFEVSTAQSGSECLEKIQDNSVDLILMDVRMPGMDGWETVKKLKQEDAVDGAKVIMLTVEKGPGVDIFGLQDVVVDYITKPFEKENLVKRVEKALD